MSSAFFDGWWPILRTLMVGIPTYVALVVFLRISGKRTLSKLNAFDFVITVALGSTLSAILTSKELAFAEGIVALGLLIALQFVVTWTSVRVPHVRRWVKSEPRLVVHHGELLDEALVDERLTRDEILAVIRQQGYSSLAEVEAVIVETDGSLSVLGELRGERAALGPVRGPHPAAREPAPTAH